MTPGWTLRYRRDPGSRSPAVRLPASARRRSTYRILKLVDVHEGREGGGNGPVRVDGSVDGRILEIVAPQPVLRLQLLGAVCRARPLRHEQLVPAQIVGELLDALHRARLALGQRFPEVAGAAHALPQPGSVWAARCSARARGIRLLAVR